MATLSLPELKKRQNWKLFLAKIEAGEPFLNDKTKKDVFIGHKDKKQTKTMVNSLKKKKPDYLSEIFKEGPSIFLPTTTGKKIKINELHKTQEFGSSGRTGTEKEDIALTEFNEAIKAMKKKSKTNTIKIYVGKKFVNVDKIISTPGTPKSDFHAVDHTGKEVAWFSHKDGSKAKDFQQWGGMTEKEIVNQKLIQDFIEAVRTKFGGAIPRATTVARAIPNTAAGKKLQGMTVYGVDFGKSEGRQNCSVLIQGPISLKKRGVGFEIVSNHIHYNGEVMKGDFAPVLMAMYKGDRSNFDVKGARFAIQPKESRKVSEWI